MRWSLTAYFTLNGIVVALWAARIPAIKHNLHLDDATLGLVLIANPLGTILGLLPAGRLIDRFGSPVVLRTAGPIVVLTLIGPALAWDRWSLGTALLVFGLAGALVDVAANAYAVLVEQAQQRPLMSSFHATYSLGGLVGAVAGGLCASAGLSPLVTFLLFVAPGSALLVFAGREIKGHVRKESGTTDTRMAPPPLSSGTWIIWVLGLLGFCSVLAEGSVEHWSAVYLQDSTGASPGLAAYGFAAYSVAMMAGRFAGDRLVMAYGPASFVRLCALIGAAGLVAGLVSRSTVGGIIGFGVLGLGLSCVFPQVLTAAGNLDPARAGSRIARVSCVGYAGLVAGPLLIGLTAGRVGLPLALTVPAILMLCVAAGARVMAVPAARSGVPQPVSAAESDDSGI